MKINNFVEELEKLGIELSEEQFNQLKKYYELIIEWNKKLNLTAITDMEEVYLKHFYDSLTLYKIIDLNKDLKVIDVGTGAGFPGIVLKICFPNLKITLLDALDKRIKFLNEVIKELNLKNIETIHERVEIFASNNRGKYDLCVTRAVAKLNILLEICSPLINEKGYFVAMKGKNDELEESTKAIKILNLDIKEVISFNLPIENSARNLIKVSKNGPINTKYPRKFDKIKKNPL